MCAVFAMSALSAGWCCGTFCMVTGAMTGMVAFIGILAGRQQPEGQYIRNQDDLIVHSKIHPILSEDHFEYRTLTRCRRSALRTTETELNAIAAPATHGANKPIAAIGIPSVL